MPQFLLLGPGLVLEFNVFYYVKNILNLKGLAISRFCWRFNYITGQLKKINEEKLLFINIVIMKPENKIMDRTTFVFVWLTIGIISTAIAVIFVIGLKTIFGYFIYS